jgi:hypothetical protein
LAIGNACGRAWSNWQLARLGVVPRAIGNWQGLGWCLEQLAIGKAWGGA